MHHNNLNPRGSDHGPPSSPILNPLEQQTPFRSHSAAGWAAGRVRAARQSDGFVLLIQQDSPRCTVSRGTGFGGPRPIHHTPTRHRAPLKDTLRLLCSNYFFQCGHLQPEGIFSPLLVSSTVPVLMSEANQLDDNPHWQSAKTFRLLIVIKISFSPPCVSCQRSKALVCGESESVWAEINSVCPRGAAPLVPGHVAAHLSVSRADRLSEKHLNLHSTQTWISAEAKKWRQTLPPFVLPFCKLRHVVPKRKETVILKECPSLSCETAECKFVLQ